jgi:hypothetical protein
MTLFEYFVLAYRHRFIYKRHWLLRAFAIVGETPLNKHREIGDFYIADGAAYTVNEDGDATIIDGYIQGSPLFNYREPITVPPGIFPIVKESVETYYSTLLTNLIVFEYAFTDAIPYQNHRLNGKYIDKLVAKALTEKTVTVEQYRAFTRAISMMTALANAVVPSATRKAIIPPSDMAERRQAVLEKYKGQLHDPAIIAKVEAELVDYYRTYLEGDDINEFMLKPKDMEVSLKRTHIMFGGEPTLEDPSKYELAIPSLREGWDMKHLPMMVNSLRMGSYNRGASTALGGEAAKFSARIFQNTKLVEDDCGSTVGITFPVTEYNKDKFVGRYRFKGKDLIPIEAGELDNLVGKTITIRSPMTCHTDHGNFCGVCMGKLVTDSKIGLGPQASAVGSAILQSFLAMMHGNRLETRKYDYLNSLT